MKFSPDSSSALVRLINQIEPCPPLRLFSAQNPPCLYVPLSSGRGKSGCAAFPTPRSMADLESPLRARKIEIRCDPLCQRSAFKKIVLGLVETLIPAPKIAILHDFFN